MLMRRNKTYYVRVFVPLDLQPIFKCKEVVRSLRTADRSEAKLSARLWEHEAERLFYTVRSGMLDSTQIGAIVEHYRTTTLKQLTNARREHGVAVYLPSDKREELRNADPEAVMEQVVIHHSRLRRQHVTDVHTNNFARVSGLAEELLREFNIEEPQGSPSFRHLCEYLIKSQIAISETVIDRMRGNFGNTGMPAAPSKPAPKLTLSDLWEAYKRAKQVKGDWTARTSIKYDGHYSDAVKILGDKYLSAYTTEDALKLLETLKKQGNSATTVTGKVEFLSSLFRFALKTPESIEKWGVRGNPFTDMQVSSSGSDRDKRLPYSHEDLVSLLSGLLTVRKRVEPHRYWVPLIALYTGMRQNEVCQLRVEDIERADKFFLFRIRHNPEKQQRVKNRQSRTCPVHPMLKSLGFIRYVEEQKAAGHDRLFSELTHTKQKDWSGIVRSWWNVTFQKNRVADKTGKSFHSLRKNFIDHFKQNRLYHKASDRAVVQSMVGHEGKDDVTSQHYETRFTAAAQYKMLVKLDYGFPAELMEKLKGKDW